MLVQEAIKSRRSVGRVKPDPVDRALIEAILEAAVYAPNHYLTEPWRFFVMTGEGRQVLGRAYAEIAREKMKDEGSRGGEEFLNKQEAKAFRAPVVIAVAASPSEVKPVIHVEELAAVHAAVQNMLLTAHALGLGAIWRSGEPMYHPTMKQAFGLQEREEMVGLIYIGYPEMIPTSVRQLTYADKTVWIDQE